MSDKKHNVIYIHTHDMGRYIGAYGHKINTPAMDAFAQKGTLFRQAFCCGPTCSPSRAGLLTGETPHQSGMLGLAHRGFSLAHPERHLASYLKGQGYQTALFGIQHEFRGGAEGFPYDYTEDLSSAKNLMEKDEMATKGACRYLEQEHDKPIFLSCGLFYPHRDFLDADPEQYKSGYLQPPAPLPDTPEVRKDMADYVYTVEYADSCLARVFKTLEEKGYLENSIVLLTTDHGIAFPEMKCSLRDHGIGVTFALHYPDNPSAGKTEEGLASHLDFYPTVCDLLELEPPAHLRGKSLRPLLEDKQSDVRDEIFSEVSFHAAYEPKRCIRTKRHKLILRCEPFTYPLANCDASPSKNFMRESGWPQNPLSQIELYDLLLDPTELNNLAGDERYNDIEKDLKARLESWMKETDDPLQEGYIPRPAGAIVNRNDSTEPGDEEYEE